VRVEDGAATGRARAVLLYRLPNVLRRPCLERRELWLLKTKPRTSREVTPASRSPISATFASSALAPVGGTDKTDRVNANHCLDDPATSILGAASHESNVPR